MARKIIHLRKNGKYAGSRSLEGKLAPTSKLSQAKSDSKILQDLLAKIGGEYRLAIQEFDAKYEISLAEAKKEFVESLSPKAKVAFFKYNGWNAFDLEELIEGEEELKKYRAASQILDDKLRAASEERRIAVEPFWMKRQADFAEAKTRYPKKWWQSYASHFGDICESCGAKIVDYCPKCNPNA